MSNASAPQDTTATPERWTPKSLAALKEFGRAVIQEAQRRGRKVRPDGGYAGNDCVCFIGAAYAVTGPRDLRASSLAWPGSPHVIESMNLTRMEGRCIERGFMNSDIAGRRVACPLSHRPRVSGRAGGSVISPTPSQAAQQRNPDEGHTPGPWELRENVPYDTGGWVVFHGRGPENRTVCRLPYGNAVPCPDTPARQRNTANARLIAAAPEMYEALQSAFALLMTPRGKRAFVTRRNEALKLVQGALRKAAPSPESSVATSEVSHG